MDSKAVPNMIQIKLKRVYEPEEAQDGFRILVDRLWPRGVKKEALHFDLWAKDIAPSTGLRTWYHQDKENNWALFREKYIDELSHSTVLSQVLEIIKDKPVVTLLFASKNAIENHALILKEYLEKELAEKN